MRAYMPFPSIAPVLPALACGVGVAWGSGVGVGDGEGDGVGVGVGVEGAGLLQPAKIRALSDISASAIKTNLLISSSFLSCIIFAVSSSGLASINHLHSKYFNSGCSCLGVIIDTVCCCRVYTHNHKCQETGRPENSFMKSDSLSGITLAFCRFQKAAVL